jgi:hypothetical protein
MRRAISTAEISGDLGEICYNQKESIGKIFAILDNDKCSYKLQREITWLLINIFCLPENVALWIEQQFNAMRILVDVTQRCNKREQELQGANGGCNGSLVGNSEVVMIHKTRENAVWALANLIPASQELKDKLIRDYRFMNILA